MAVSFKQEVILMGVRWYVAYPLSTRHVEELMEERGVAVDEGVSELWICYPVWVSEWNSIPV